jgi:5'-nucleotidase
MIESIRNSEDHVLLLDSGGVFADRGQRLKLKTDVILKAMDLMGYDALNLGSREFFFGLDFLKSVSSGISFPFISSNLVYDKSRFPWIKDHILKNVGGLRVAILGVMPVEAFENIPDPGSLKNLKIIPPETALKNLLPKVRKKADFVILLSQLGFEATTSLVDKLNGVDLAISYGRKRIGHPDKGRTLVVHTGSQGKSLGFLQITMSENGEIIEHQWKTIKLGESVADDERIAKLVKDDFPKKATRQELEQEMNKLLKLSPHEYIEMLNKKQAEEGDKR